MNKDRGGSYENLVNDTTESPSNVQKIVQNPTNYSADIENVYAEHHKNYSDHESSVIGCNEKISSVPTTEKSAKVIKGMRKSTICDEANHY